MLIRHHDDEFFDEVRIYIKPRFKTSGLSGNEWRISAVTELYRKGECVWSDHHQNIETAAKFLSAQLVLATENLPADMRRVGDDQCAQPGCSETYVSEYRLVKKGCPRCGEADVGNYPGRDHRIRFCRKHLRRGDASLEDADANYEVVSGPGPEEAEGWEEDESPAAFGGVVEVNLSEDKGDVK